MNLNKSCVVLIILYKNYMHLLHNSCMKCKFYIKKKISYQSLSPVKHVLTALHGNCMFMIENSLLDLTL